MPPHPAGLPVPLLEALPGCHLLVRVSGWDRGHFLLPGGPCPEWVAHASLASVCCGVMDEGVTGRCSEVSSRGWSSRRGSVVNESD